METPETRYDGVATMLFTVIVESTVRTAELGDRGWAELVGAHNALVRRCSDRFAGKEIDTAGDGEMLVSSTVKDLVAGSGIGFVERASAELRGVPGEWHLYAVER